MTLAMDVNQFQQFMVVQKQQQAAMAQQQQLQQQQHQEVMELVMHFVEELKSFLIDLDCLRPVIVIG
uniref:Uncharacterized protein n=1 Tax=Ditylenchus dipsaci TaxID=166011 RepID=A0A915CQ37_9BILA